MAKLFRLGLGLASLVTCLGLFGSSRLESGAQTQSQGSQGSPVAGVEIKPAASTNYYSYFLAEIVNLGLAELGYAVEDTQQLQIALAHVAVSNGDADFLTAHWENLNGSMLAEANRGSQTVERVGVLVDDAIQGYVIDRATAEEYGITTLEQLQDPDLARLFDADGDGKADLIGCNPGWSCGTVTEHHLETYGLLDTVEFVQGEYDALIADTITRLGQGESILAYTYSPHWAGESLDTSSNVTWLEVPYTSLPEPNQDLTEDDTTLDGLNLGFAVDRIRVVANSAYLEENPVARRWLELVEVPLGDVNAQQKLVQDGENRPEDIQRHAQDWVEQNQELFEDWLADARQAAG